MKNSKERKLFGAIKLTRSNMGFYIALAICIVTVAAAAWTTYGSIIQDRGEISDDIDGSELQTAEDVSGESYEKNSAENDKAAADSTDEISDTKNNNDNDASDRESKADESSAAETYYPVEDKSVMKVFSVSSPVFSKTTTDWRTHGGADFQAEKGTAVRAITQGVVTSIYKDAMYGNTIEIEHEGFCAKYCGLSDNPIVHKGDHVDAGSTIGYVGTVPCEMLDENHIHLETTVNSVKVDPMSILENHHK